MSNLEHPWQFEERGFAQGYTHICGVDEAGAGPLAGPVYAAAVILPRNLQIAGLNDSKKLSPSKREHLFCMILEHAESFAIASASVEEIDRLNILNARLLAMQRAIDGLKLQPDFALIDGNRDHGDQCAIRTPHELIVHGDAESASIAAASILAKVSRDRYVCEVLDRKYPEYQFARHKGYGTKLHYEMLDLHGPCPDHRVSFLKKWKCR